MITAERMHAYYAQTASGPDVEVVEEAGLRLEQLPEPQQTDYQMILSELGLAPERVRFVCYSGRSRRRFFTVQSVYESTRFDTLAELIGSESSPCSSSGVRCRQRRSA